KFDSRTSRPASLQTRPGIVSGTIRTEELSALQIAAHHSRHQLLAALTLNLNLSAAAAAGFPHAGPVSRSSSAILSIVFLAISSDICSAWARASSARSRQCLGSLMES